MPKRNQIPSYLLHKPTGQGYCRWNGRCYYFGKHGTTESKQAYRRFCAELIASGSAPAAVKTSSLSVSELVERYLHHARTKYQARHVLKLESVLGITVGLYGSVNAAEFGPSKLRAVQVHLSNQGLCAATVNQRVMMLRKCFKWAVSWELIPGGVSHALREVEGLKKPPAIARPAPEADVSAALPYMPESVKAMVLIQRLTGMRPGEVCALNREEIVVDQPSPGTWLYSPVKHKNAHHGHTREILIGPAAQELLLPWLSAREPGEFIFQPRDSLPYKPKRHRKRKIHDRYSPEAYAKAVHRACDAAGVTPFSPNQLRHAAATRIASEFSPEMARVILGHKTLGTTEHYVQGDLAKAAEVMRKAG